MIKLKFKKKFLIHEKHLRLMLIKTKLFFSNYFLTLKLYTTMVK